ncbi:hypothetical protein BgiBS90_025806 [Biomphalaria glabrata]|nr:hypothetical protein BgiBS90_025806 [Biomphalaria glabrata]
MLTCKSCALLVLLFTFLPSVSAELTDGLLNETMTCNCLVLLLLLALLPCVSAELTDGEIAGITVGCCFVAVIVVLFLCCRYTRYGRAKWEKFKMCMNQCCC